MIYMNLGLFFELHWRYCVINISLRKLSVMNSKNLGLIQIVKKFFVKNKKRGLKQIRKEEQRRSSEIS